MPRLDRLASIHILLQSRRVITAREIAERFGITLRTVYRDLRALQDSGVPVEGEAGLGYYLPKCYKLPPGLFTRDEGLALLMAGKLMETQRHRKMAESYRSALTRIRATLNQEEKDILESLDTRIQYQFHAGESRSPVIHSQEAHLFTQLQNAIAEGRVISLDYTSGKAESSTRQLEPMGLCYYALAWHLIAWCRLRMDYRDFRIDRIVNVFTQEERFSRLGKMDLQEYLTQIAEQYSLLQIRVLFDPGAALMLRHSGPSMGLVEERIREDKSVEAEFLFPSCDGFARWLLGFAGGCQVLEPENLRKRLVTLAQQAISVHALKMT